MAYIQKKGETWSFTIEQGKDRETGNRKRMTRGGFKCKKDAMKAAYEFNVKNETNK